MPQVIQGIILFIGDLGAKYAAASAFTKAVISIATTVAINKVSQMLGPKAPKVRDFPQDVEYSDTMASRRIIYGENKVSGMNVIPPLVTGTDGAYLHQVLALAGHEVNAIGNVYFDQDLLSLDGSGNVSSGRFSGKATVRKYLGTSTQTADSILTAAVAEWTSDHRGRGISYLALRYQYDTTAYRSGKPDVTCIVQGKKCYDPRLDTSPGANPTNSTYAAYTTNPALCLADYLVATYGLSESVSRVDWSLVVSAANICDENVTIPGSTTQKRFTCNIVLDAVASFEQNIEALALAMMGTCYYSGGKWRMYAGAWSSSAFSITQDNVIGEISIRTAASRKSDGYYNAVRGRFIDKDRDYQPLEFEPILNSTYETQDGNERIYTEVDFPACNNQYEAQRNAIILSKQSRRQKVVTVVCDFSCYKIRPWETGTATIPEVNWSSQPVRCIGWRFRPDPAIELTLQEVASTDYSDPAPGDYVTPASVSVTNPAAYKPGTPQSFTAVQEIESILLQWAAPTNTVPGVLYQVFEYSSSTPFSSATKIYEGADTQLRVPRTDTNTRYFWVRSYYAPSNGFSTETPSGAGLSSSGRIATVNGYLTSEAVALEANAAGTISDYSPAVGFFKMFSGSTDVTSSTAFSLVSETNLDGDLNTADNTPVSGQVKGYYRVTSLTADTGVLKMSATYGGVTITKDFTVTRAKDGLSPVNIYLSQAAIAIPANADGSSPDFTNASTTVSIFEGGTDVSSSWSVSASPSTGITGTLSTRTYTLTGMTVDTGYVEFTASRSGYTNLVIRLAVSKAKKGTDGTNGLSATMTLDAVTLMSYADGTVVSFTPAAGRIYVYSGGTDVTSSATLVATATDCTGTVNTATDTPVSGQPKGYYRVTAMSADTATLKIDATYSGTTITKFFSLSKNKVGYEIVGTLPSTNLFEGRIVFLTTDDKLYRYTGTAWTTAVPAVDISGTLADSQIAALAASKITGQLTNTQIADLAATKITGQLSDSQLAAIAAAKVTGQITGTQITDGAISTAKLAAGAVTANEIAANTITAAKIAAGTITATELASGSVTTAKLAAGAVTANEIAANAITAAKIQAGAVETAKIAAGAVTANEIAANTITAAKIAASTITATEIASNAITSDKINAGAVTAAKISVTNLAAINADMGNITAGTIVLPSSGFIRSGQTAYNSGTGFYIGNDSGTPKLSLGNSSGKRITWDGSDFTIAGGIVVTDSIATSAVTNVATASDNPTGKTPSDITTSHTSVGNPVFIVCTLEQVDVVSSTSATITYTLELLRDTTSLVVKTFKTTGEPMGGGLYDHSNIEPISFNYIDIGLTAGSYTFKFKVSHNGTSGTTNWYGRTLFTQESKR